MAKDVTKRWQTDEALISSWLEMGAHNGDIYRRYLINPVIYGLLASPDWEMAPSPINHAIAKWHDTYCKPGTGPQVDEWYTDWTNRTIQANSILDLGCGEAYRGRWLSKSSVKYVGVDVSEPLLAKALADGRFRCEVRDLDIPNPLLGLWVDAVPPEWVMAITLLDQLEHPDRLLSDIAALYGTRHSGQMLVVTCNPEFYGYSGEGAQPVKARIATVNCDGGGVAYLRSRQSIRKLFRDSGMNVIDEASPHLPKCLATQRGFDATNFNLAHAPFVFWLVELHSTKRERVDEHEVKNWLAELQSASGEDEVVRALLERLSPEVEHLRWRLFQQDQAVVRRHNIGGRLFVVREGSFEVDIRDTRSTTESESSVRRRWKFRPNEVFGELEIEQGVEQRDLQYSSSVVAKQVGPLGHARILEIPAEVTRELMRAPSLLGNPFFNLLRRKVLDGLLRYDPTSLQKPMTTSKKFKRTLELHEAPKDQLNLTARHVVAVASLLLQGLEGDRARALVLDPRHRLVVVTHMRNALSEVTGKTLEADDMTEYNRAIRFLSTAGLIRAIRPVANEVEGSSEPFSGSERRGTISQQFKSVLELEAWVLGLSLAVFNALHRLMGRQSACFFVVDDELALRRCVMEPSLELIDDLTRRRRLFFPQPEDVELARDIDLAGALQEGIRVRFTSDHWHTDSLGLSLIDD